MDAVDCLTCGASQIVDDGEAWVEEHAHSNVVVTPLDD